jgi:hypothetical protein
METKEYIKIKIPDFSQGFLLFGFGKCFDAFGADFLFHSVHFFHLKINLKFSKRSDVRVASAVSGLRSAAANITDSTHWFIGS